jgi:diguanylate cyclase
VLFEKLGNLVRSWSESPAAANMIEIETEAPLGEAVTASTPAESPAPIVSAITNPVAASRAALIDQPENDTALMLSQLSELLAQTLESTISAQPELSDELRRITEQVRKIKTMDQITQLALQLRQFWLKVELRGSDKTKIHDGILRLLRLLVENVGEMVDDEDWLHGQIKALHEIIINPIDKHVIADAERSLREAIIKQGMLKKSLSDAKSTLKNLMATFIDRLGNITVSTGDYHDKIEGYSQKIAQSNNLNDLGSLLNDIMQDTRVIQASASRTHEELLDSRKQVEEAEAKIQELEKELAQVSELVHQDQLTGALNRRGMDDAFDRETKRVDRSNLPLCVALLDIDDFKRLNDTLGHQVGDQALIHLCTVIKEALRPSDSVARYGGEEFVIILPEISLEEAATTVERLQRELTKKFFLHENDRVLVTFSAGVAQRGVDEPQEEVIGRADKAMYQAKHTGKNRVIMAN